MTVRKSNPRKIAKRGAAGSGAALAGLKIYLCFERTSGVGLADDLRNQLRGEGADVIDFDRCLQWHNGATNVDQFYKLIGESDAFIFLHTESALKSDERRRIKQEYSFAMYYANNACDKETNREKPYPLIRLVYNDFEPFDVPIEFSAFVSVDYRGSNAVEMSLDALVMALRPDRPPTLSERQAYIFKEALEPNPRREMYTHALREEFGRAFKEHIGPLSERIKQLAELTKAQDNLMTPEIISVKEADAFDDIWVASHSLHNDLYAEDISESIEKNLRSGIRYVYFVPRTPLIEGKMRQFKKRYERFCSIDASGDGPHISDARSRRRDADRSGSFTFYHLDAGVFMPFDELVVYDGENPTHRWGYIQMRYDLAARSTNGDGLIMKVPDRTLNTIVTYLLKYKEKHTPALLCPAAEAVDE
jgi:hypothetical protein